jgi:hypothetical protein
MQTPDLIGKFGEAWKLDMAAIRNKTGQKDSTIEAWVVHSPAAHPLFHVYLIYCLHLRPTKGVKPANISLRGATHEIGVWVVDPAWKLRTDDVPVPLHPANFVAQFIESEDEKAAVRVRHSVHEIITGRLSPDTDYIQHWIQRYGSSNIKGDPNKAGQTRMILATPGKPMQEIVIPPKQPGEKPDNSHN